MIGQPSWDVWFVVVGVMMYRIPQRRSIASVYEGTQEEHNREKVFKGRSPS